MQPLLPLLLAPAMLAPDVSKSFTPIGDGFATIPQRTGFAGAKFALMNYTPVFAASQSSPPAPRYDKAMRLCLLRSPLSPIAFATASAPATAVAALH